MTDADRQGFAATAVRVIAVEVLVLSALWFAGQYFS